MGQLKWFPGMLEMIGDVAWPTTNDTGPTNPQDAEALRLLNVAVRKKYNAIKR